jgi:hypothetical protein
MTRAGDDAVGVLPSSAGTPPACGDEAMRSGAHD